MSLVDTKCPNIEYKIISPLDALKSPELRIKSLLDWIKLLPGSVIFSHFTLKIIHLNTDYVIV